MKKYLFFAVGSWLGGFVGTPYESTDKYESCKSVDVVVHHGVNKFVYKDVTITDEQEDFCMFTQNGVGRIEKAPYEIVCNK